MRRSAAVIFLAVSVTSRPLLGQSAPCAETAEMGTEFGHFKQLGLNLSKGFIPPIREDEAIRSIRLLIQPIAKPGETWTLTVRDGVDRPLQSIPSSSFSDGLAHWTSRFTANTLQIVVESNDNDVRARALEYVAVPKAAEHPYYSIQGATPQWKNLYGPDAIPSQFRRLGDSVGMFVSHSGTSVSGVKVWTCSGFVIENKPAVLFVTNYHCGGPWVSNGKWPDDVCRNATVDFSWDGDAMSREYICSETYLDPDDDLAVLKVTSSAPEAPPPVMVLRSAPLQSEDVEIIHHPAALEKSISSACAGVTDEAAQAGTVNLTRDFAHRCDSEGGSSGAPVLDQGGRVVGIHHLGFEKTTSNSCDMFNKAIRVSKLIDFLKAKQITGYKVD